jgi:porin
MDDKDKHSRTNSPMRNVARRRCRNASVSAPGRMPYGLATVVLSLVVIATSTAAQDLGPAASGTNATVPAAEWRGLDTLSGDSGDAWTRLSAMGFTFKSKITQFYQGQAAGDGDPGPKYGGKADLMMRSDLSKLGFWDGLSLTVKGELNFGQSLNASGGTLIPINTALYLPGEDGADYSDISSFFFTQQFSKNVSLTFGKMNMIDLAAPKPYMGDSGIKGFWNLTFVAPPSSVVPPYLFGAILGVKTEAANYTLMVYDPNDATNKNPLEDPFSDGVTIRGTIEFPVTLGGLPGHQSFTALYSTYPGTDFETIGSFVPGFPPGTPGLKDERYYFNYAFDQQIFQSASNPEQVLGLFGQFSLSDGNPTTIYWSALGGVSGTGFVPGRPADDLGLGVFYTALSSSLKDALPPVVNLNDEWGVEAYYDFALSPSASLGLDLQVIEPGLGDSTAVFVGMRLVSSF